MDQVHTVMQMLREVNLKNLWVPNPSPVGWHCAKMSNYLFPYFGNQVVPVGWLLEKIFFNFFFQIWFCYNLFWGEVHRIFCKENFLAKQIDSSHYHGVGCAEELDILFNSRDIVPKILNSIIQKLNFFLQRILISYVFSFFFCFFCVDSFVSYYFFFLYSCLLTGIYMSSSACHAMIYLNILFLKHFFLVLFFLLFCYFFSLPFYVFLLFCYFFFAFLCLSFCLFLFYLRSGLNEVFCL